jgi:3-methyl-2-oxobutanoate hydroxymethyltransferase
MSRKVTAPGLRQMMEAGEKIVCITAYDYTSALLCDSAGVDVVLVGDSLGNVVQGHSTTVPVTLEEMVYHTRCVRRGLSSPLLVGDLPFGSYNVSVSQAVESAIALMKAGADAVKLEGDYTEEISAIVKAGIPVMGHVGFTPQSINEFGGHKVQGRGDSGDGVLKEALSIQEAGAFGVVLEMIPAEVATMITKKLEIPTIGIGAGAACDGQIQVWHDVFGLSARKLKHARWFAQGQDIFGTALSEYIASTKSGEFPTSENSF